MESNGLTQELLHTLQRIEKLLEKINEKLGADKIEYQTSSTNCWVCGYKPGLSECTRMDCPLGG